MTGHDRSPKRNTLKSIGLIWVGQNYKYKHLYHKKIK